MTGKAAPYRRQVQLPSGEHQYSNDDATTASYARSDLRTAKQHGLGCMRGIQSVGFLCGKAMQS
jgi:hypothetical protein